MGLLTQSAFLKALGWALLNSIWQMGVIWIVFLLITAGVKKMTAQVKHTLAVLLLTAGFIWFGTTLAIQYFNYTENPIILGTAAIQATQSLSFAELLSGSARNLEILLPYLSIVYIAITIFLFFRFVSQYRYTRFVCTHEVEKPGVELRLYVNRIAERMGIKKDIRVWLSNIVDTPMTIGFWKPIILMPVASINGLSIQQVEAILLHELSHIRRNDYVVNLLIASVDIILFFNPFSKLLIRTIRKEREHSCDDLVLQFEYNAHAYASALLNIEQKRAMTVALAIAATGRNNRLLLDRVKRILNQPVSVQNNNRMFAHLFSALIIGCIGWSNPGNVIVHQLLERNIEKPVAASLESIAKPIVNTEIKETRKDKVVKSATQKDPYENFESALEKVSEDLATLAAFDEHQQFTAQFVQASGMEKLRDFSISEPVATLAPSVAITSAPFIPSGSFSYYSVQDSSKPTVVIAPTADEKAAKESLKKALRALEEIDWKVLENELKASGEKVDVRKLQEELKRSLKELDWEKINIELKLEALDQQTKMNKDKFYSEMLKVTADNEQMQEHTKNMQKKIIEDQLQCQQETLRKEEELKKYLHEKKVKPVKKIVVI